MTSCWEADGVRHGLPYGEVPRSEGSQRWQDTATGSGGRADFLREDSALERRA